VPVAACDLPGAVGAISLCLTGNAKTYVSLVAAHSIQDARRSQPARVALTEAGLVVPDGMAVVWLLRMSGHQGAGRVYGPDLMMELCARSIEHGWSHFFVGGRPGVRESLVARLSERFPGLIVAGSLSPEVCEHPRVEPGVVAMINASGARIVWVGLGSPKQDQWMHAYREALEPNILIGVGAAFDFVAGAKRQAPRWVQRSGLEWLFRWLSEPARLTRRYVRYPEFATTAGWQLVTKRLRRLIS